MAVRRRKLTVSDRVLIEVRLGDGWGMRAIARALDRSAGMVSDEINRHGGAAGYRAQAAAAQADTDRRLTGRRRRLVHDGALFGRVAELLCLGWSPEQISGRRKRMEAGMQQPSGLSVSHEAIYPAIYALPRGELRRELIGCLRQDKPLRGRKPKGSERRGKLCNMTNIKARPEEIEGRLVPAGRARSARWSSERPASSCWCGCRRARPMWLPLPLPAR
jgi:IS30 family transposase